MGLLKKIANSYLCSQLEQGCINQGVKFLQSGQEFNMNIMPCADGNYSEIVYQDFVEKYSARVSVEDVGCAFLLHVEFEGQHYEIYNFKHYARTFNVSITLETECTDCGILCDFLNEINMQDYLDQIGFFEANDKTYIRIFRHFLSTPHIGSGDILADGLRDLKRFAEQIAVMQYPGDADWMKWANPKPSAPIATAADFWFHQGEDSCLKNLSSQAKMIEKDEKHESRSMISITGSRGVFTVVDKLFLDGRITVFPDMPYLTLMEVVVKIENGNVNDIMSFLSQWNSSIHFSPCRVVFLNDEDHNLSFLKMMMSGLYADDVNTRTFVDFLCSLQMCTGLMVQSISKKQ